jgi:phosphonate transport system ATP-binding protein
VSTQYSPSGDLPLDPVAALATAGSSTRATAARTMLAPGVKLAVHDLTMQYANGHTALRDFNVSVNAGEMVVVLGSNGSGKSTFMKCVD